MVNLVIPTKNDVHVMMLLRSIFWHTTFTAEYAITIVDDGLKRPEIVVKRPEHVPLCPQPRIVEGMKPFVFARNVNLGITAGTELNGKSDVIVLNDDTRIQTSDWIGRLSRATRNYKFGVVAPLLDRHIRAYQDKEFYVADPAVESALAPTPVDMIPFTCAYITRDTLDIVGMLDERFTQYGYEDDDYCRRVRNAGIQIGVCRQVLLSHIVSASFDRSKRSTLQAHNKKIYEEKWGS